MMINANGHCVEGDETVGRCSKWLGNVDRRMSEVQLDGAS